MKTYRLNVILSVREQEAAKGMALPETGWVVKRDAVEKSYFYCDNWRIDINDNTAVDRIDYKGEAVETWFL